MLLEQGALCERDTFQGERCLYNALNDRIRNLLLSYDYSKSADPLQPLAAHITGLLSRETPKTADIAVHTGEAEGRQPAGRRRLRVGYLRTAGECVVSVPHWVGCTASGAGVGEAGPEDVANQDGASYRVAPGLEAREW